MTGSPQPSQYSQGIIPAQIPAWLQWPLARTKVAGKSGVWSEQIINYNIELFKKETENISNISDKLYFSSPVSTRVAGRSLQDIVHRFYQSKMLTVK